MTNQQREQEILDVIDDQGGFSIFWAAKMPFVWTAAASGLSERDARKAIRLLR